MLQKAQIGRTSDVLLLTPRNTPQSAVNSVAPRKSHSATCLVALSDVHVISRFVFLEIFPRLGSAHEEELPDLGSLGRSSILIRQHRWNMAHRLHFLKARASYHPLLNHVDAIIAAVRMQIMPPKVVFRMLAAPVELATAADPVVDPVWLPLDEVVDALSVADARVLVEPEGLLVELEAVLGDVLSALDSLLVLLDDPNALTSTGTAPGQAFMHSCVGIQSTTLSPLLPG